MQPRYLPFLLPLLSNMATTTATTTATTPQALLDRITSNAARDNIDLSVLPFWQEALDSITSLAQHAANTPLPDFSNATRIDTHTHPIPDWFRALEPSAAGRDTPSWNLSAHLHFMAEHGIKKSILSVSTPQANAFATPSKFETDPDLRREKTVALARLLNEFVAQVCRVFPDRFGWLAVTALPYVEESVAEVKYGVDELGAVGISVLTNAEGVYPGDVAFEGLWRELDKRAQEGGGREVVFVHPTDPVVVLEDGRLVSSRPCTCFVSPSLSLSPEKSCLQLLISCSSSSPFHVCSCQLTPPAPLRSGLGEFYFETARAISSLTASSYPYTSTLLKYPHLHWRISHGAGAFPDISERFLLGFPKEAAAAREAYKTRLWYDSAGPVWPKQVKGLMEGLGVGVGQMVFGTDYPYGIGFWDVGENIAGLAGAEDIDEGEREGVWWRNAEGLWRGRIGG